MTYHQVNRPVEFQGTREEAAANFASHAFSWSLDPDEAGDERCFNCDSRPSYAAASYPCGAEVPRETVLFVEPGETVLVKGEGSVDFLHGHDSIPSGVLTWPAETGVFITGVDALTYRLNGDISVEEAA